MDNGNQAKSSGQQKQLRIQETAYLLWEAAGCQHGRSLEYWLAAERELLAHAKAEPTTEQPAAGPTAVRAR